ncbi:iota-carrageenase [Catenovulum agarivorans DS-2]|uniref:Iota-carrageenase n=1 Tax=Catenovulum agarivorans DS-2 TaxID=1328313 RepID=W7QWD3_9ALTE|nr:glycosyl hydrolase family 28-related protein [Catenovulum agarivorans]EWH09565.1 iota-carrageenase [Catenovulum agarivorans DS-2]
MGISNLIPKLAKFAALTLACGSVNYAYAQEDGSWVTVDSATIEQSARYTKRRVGYYTFNTVSVPENTELSEQLRIVVTDSSHNVLDADGLTASNQPYFNLNKITDSLQINFAMKRAAFSYNAELQQYVLAEPEVFSFGYDFNSIEDIQTENNNWEGWVYPTRNRGVMAFEDTAGADGSAAFSYTDTSTNTNITQNGIRFNNRTNKKNINPWTDALATAYGETLESVSLWVKVEKAVAGNVTVRHNLVPFPVIDDKKGPTINAGIDLGPQYEMVIPASANNTWVQVEFVDTKTGLKQFTIPETWVHYDGESDIQVYPQFLFDGLEIGDKVYVDNYKIGAPLENACCEPVEDDTGTGGGSDGNTGDDTGGSGNNSGVEEPEYNLGDQLVFNYSFDSNEVAENQGSQGWIYSVIDRGAMAFEDGLGRSGAALSYTDTSVNVNPEQNGIYLQKWRDSEFTARFANHGHIIKSVKVWVKTELTTEKDIEVIHYLLPYGLVSGNKRNNYPAAVAAAPKYVGVVPAGSTGWVEINLELQDQESNQFIIPSTWFGYNNGDLNIYPEFKFGNTEVGDKIYLDDYEVLTEVGEPLPIPTDFTIEYDFNDATVAQNGGWGFVLAGFGTIGLEEGSGYQNSNAISYTDSNAATNIDNQSLLWHKWGNANPWSQAFGGGKIETEIQSVTLLIKVEKGEGNLGTEPVTIKHHLLPWNVTLDGGKFGKVEAAKAVTADYTASINSADFENWVEVTFVDANTNAQSFSIPDSWILTNGSDIVDVLPSFFFGGLEVGDKVIIDDYVLTGDNALARSGAIVNEEPEHDYGLHDGSGTYTSNPRPTPLPVVDTDFYIPPTQYGVEKNAVTDFAVNNTDTEDDTASMQLALDQISAEQNGGKLYMPAGHYYFRSLHMRSNVHLEVDEGAVFHITPGGGYNVWMFEMGNQSKAENFSLVGLGNGFTVDLRDAPNERTAVFKMGDIENFKFSNFKIEDNKTIFASFLVGIVERDNDIFWPVNGIIENIDQSNSLFGYGLVQMYGADNILFRNLHSEGGITLRMETDNLTMKDYGKGGIRNIFAEDIRGTDCLSPVMFGPHFQQNGSVQVNGVVSNGCGFAVRVDGGFVELFSPAGETHTRQSWRDAVNAEIGEGCAQQPYARGNNQWASRITPTKACLDEAHRRYGLKPGWFAESHVYNVTAINGIDAHLKQDQLDYFTTTNQTCANVCLPTNEQWSRQGQIYIGPSIGGVLDENKLGVDYNFNINIYNLNMVDFATPKLDFVNGDTATSRVCNYYGMQACPDSRW